MKGEDEINRTLFGVAFTAAEWTALKLQPPRWVLEPPQREEYDSDYDYAIGEREYARRVIEAGQK